MLPGSSYGKRTQVYPEVPAGIGLRGLLGRVKASHLQVRCLWSSRALQGLRKGRQ